MTALHIMCNVTNNGARTGVLQRLEARITPPGLATDTFVWDQFYKYLEGGRSFAKESDPHPIAVGPRDSKVLRVHFAPDDGRHRFDWRGGEYRVELQGWVNRGGRNRRPNLNAKFHFFVKEMDAVEFRDEFHHEPTAKAFPVAEWQHEAPRDQVSTIMGE